MKRTLHIIAFSLLLFTSCKNVQKMVDKGEYDEAIVYAAEKLQGEENRKTKYVVALEDAFERVMRQDFKRLDNMKSSDRPEFYGKIYHTYKRIEKRQERIRPFLPLISEDGYVAHFKMIDVRPVLEEYAGKDAAYHYELAEVYLEEFTEDKKYKARSAYKSLLTVNKYFDQYKEMDELMIRSRFLGTEHVYVTAEMGPYAILDPISREAFYNVDVRNMDKEWITFHSEIDEDIVYDYKVILELSNINIEGEKEKAHTFHYNKEIQDGWNYVLDKKGNVKKDSLGNDIKEPKYIDIKARVTEVERHKEAHLLAEVKIINLHTAKEIERHAIDAHIDFNGFSCKVRGDKRALKGADKKHNMDKHLEPFPLDEEMIYEGIIHITKEAKRKIKKQFS